jgi:glycosyltransferase involved in cell wall biosynthesis
MPESAELRKLAIVPAYNEQGMVGRVVRDIGRQAPGFHVLVVDDGSTDATAAEAEARRQREAELRRANRLAERDQIVGGRDENASG